jgi:hypothetical protein
VLNEWLTHTLAVSAVALDALCLLVAARLCTLMRADSAAAACAAHEAEAESLSGDECELLDAEAMQEAYVDRRCRMGGVAARQPRQLSFMGFVVLHSVASSASHTELKSHACSRSLWSVRASLPPHERAVTTQLSCCLFGYMVVWVGEAAAVVTCSAWAGGTSGSSGDVRVGSPVELAISFSTTLHASLLFVLGFRRALDVASTFESRRLLHSYVYLTLSFMSALQLLAMAVGAPPMHDLHLFYVVSLGFCTARLTLGVYAALLYQKVRPFETLATSAGVMGENGENAHEMRSTRGAGGSVWTELPASDDSESVATPSASVDGSVASARRLALGSLGLFWFMGLGFSIWIHRFRFEIGGAAALVGDWYIVPRIDFDEWASRRSYSYAYEAAYHFSILAFFVGYAAVAADHVPFRYIAELGAPLLALLALLGAATSAKAGRLAAAAMMGGIALVCAMVGRTVHLYGLAARHNVPQDLLYKGRF